MRRYLFALITVIAAVLVKLAVNEVIPSANPFLIFVSAVMISGWFGGLGAGLFATFLSVIVADFLFFAPSFAFTMMNADQAFQLLLFIFDGALISLLCWSLRTTQKFRIESEALFRRIFDSNMVGIIFADYKGDIVDANDAALGMIGYSREDLEKGRLNWPELTPASEREASQAQLDRVRATGSCPPFAKNYIHKDGHLVPVMLGATRIDGSSRFNTVSFFVDVSNQRRAEEELARVNENLKIKVADRSIELQQAYSFLDSLIENIPNMIFVKDAKDLKFVRFNRAGEELLGVSRDNLIGKSDRDFFPEDQVENFISKDRAVLAGNSVIDIPEEPISTPQGLRYLHTKKIPVRNEKGEPQYLLGISEDITEKKQAEAERISLKAAAQLQVLSDASDLLSSSLDYQTTLKNLTDFTVPRLADWCAVSIVDGHGQLKQIAVAHSNPEKVKWAWELEKLYPVNMSASTGAPQVLRSGQSQIVSDVSDDMMIAGAKDEKHLEIIRSIGFKSYICAPLIARGHVMGVITLVTSTESNRRYGDTDLKLVEEIAERAGLAMDNAILYQEAQTLNRIKDEFLATLSHELRTPLNVIMGHAEIMKSEGNFGEFDQSVDAIYRNAKAQTQIITDLLDVSAIITGKMVFTPTDMRPADIVEAAIDSIEFSATSKNIKIVSHITEPRDTIRGDAIRLQQVVWNLLSNALKFTPNGGRVDVSVLHEAENCVIIVEDNGLGIEAEFIPYIFERFRQEDSSSTRRFGGLGIGLAITRQIVELHGGQVSATSSGRGQGAKFIVRLPLKTLSRVLEPAAAKSSVPPLDTSRPPDLRERRILVVDDEADNRALLKRFLERAGANVTVCSSAQSALDLLDHERFELILSDIGMPDVDGFGFMEEFRGREKTRGTFTPAAALTAYAREDEVQRALSSGYQVHIAKPVTSQVLVQQVSNLLNS